MAGQCASGPYAGEPADRPGNRTTTSSTTNRHHARKRTPRSRRVRVTRLRVVVKVSHLLAAASPCTRRRPVHASRRLSSFEVYYVFRGARERERGASVQSVPRVWLYKGRRPRANTRDYMRNARRGVAVHADSTDRRLLFRVRRPCFCEILGRHLSFAALSFSWCRCHHGGSGSAGFLICETHTRASSRELVITSRNIYA